MDVKKIAVIMVALLAGGAAFYLTLTGQEEPAEAPAPIVQAVVEDTINVRVAVADIMRGDLINDDTTRWVEWPKRLVNESTLYVTDEGDGGFEAVNGSVARVSFTAGEPIVESKIVRPGSRGLMAALLTPGMRAVSMQVRPETASGGFILPGDHVDIIETRSSGRNTATKGVTLFEDIRVLAVNDIFAENVEAPVIEGVNITLEMTPLDAEAFVAARNGGSLSLVLRSIHDENKASAPTDEPVQERAPKRVKVIRIGRS